MVSREKQKMNSEKISTTVGTVILVIIAVTIFAFVWVYEQGQDRDVAITQMSQSTNTTDVVRPTKEDSEGWVSFNSVKDTQLNKIFNFQHPSSWIQKGSIDGGSGSMVPFFEKDRYSQACSEKERGVTICRETGKVAVLIVSNPSFIPAKIKYDNETRNNITINGYPATEISGIVNTDTGGNGYIGESGQKETRVVIQDVSGLRFELVMLIKGDSDEAVFSKILKTIEFKF